MSVFDRRVAQKLQLLCTVTDYHRVTTPSNSREFFSPFSAGDEYWQYIPSYLVSRCPFCNFVYYAQIDTYQFYPKSISQDYQGAISQRKDVHDFSHCPHYVANQKFLDKHQPFSERELWGRPRVPGIYQRLLPADLDSYMVMHALPVCETENEQFVPKYSLYLTVYFCEKPETLWQRWHDAVARFSAQDPEFYSSFLSEHADMFNFTDWIDQKRLYWLDLADRDLQLRNEPRDEFPYINLPPDQRGPGGLPHFLRGYKGPVENPNSIHWEPGAFVIHEHDARKQDLLLTVVGYTPDGLCQVRYFSPERAKRPDRVVAVELKYLHDPRLFNIRLPSQKTSE